MFIFSKKYLFKKKMREKIIVLDKQKLVSITKINNL